MWALWIKKKNNKYKRHAVIEYGSELNVCLLFCFFFFRFIFNSFCFVLSQPEARVMVWVYV